MLRYLRISALLCAGLFTLATLEGCASSGDKSRTKSERVASNKKKKKNSSDNFMLYGKKRELDYKLLRRGERAMHAPALDSY